MWRPLVDVVWKWKKYLFFIRSPSGFKQGSKVSASLRSAPNTCHRHVAPSRGRSMKMKKISIFYTKPVGLQTRFEGLRFAPVSAKHMPPACGALSWTWYAKKDRRRPNVIKLSLIKKCWQTTSNVWPLLLLIVFYDVPDFYIVENEIWLWYDTEDWV